MKQNPYQSVKDFENRLAEFVKAPYAIAVDSCTNAIFLCCKWLGVQSVTIPSKTYVSVPCAILHAGAKVNFENIEWQGKYQLSPYPIFDSACQLSKGMYEANTFQCVSFSHNKIIPIGKGGMIFTDCEKAYKWFKLARYEGREECPLLEQKEFIMAGWNMYMTPEQASRGLALSCELKEHNIIFPQYPDLMNKFRPQNYA